MGADLRKFAVFSVRKDSKTGATVWVRAGSAFANRDGSMSVLLDVLPLDGKLTLRPHTGLVDPEVESLRAERDALVKRQEEMALQTDADLAELKRLGSERAR